MTDSFNSLVMHHLPALVSMIFAGVMAVLGLVVANFLDIRDIKKDVSLIAPIGAEQNSRGQVISGFHIKHRAYEEGIASCFKRIERLENKIFLSQIGDDWFYWVSNS